MATHNNPQDQESWLTLTLERQSLAVRGEIVRSHQIYNEAGNCGEWQAVLSERHVSPLSICGGCVSKMRPSTSRSLGAAV